MLDGRFKGGYITRNYGKPHGRVHAIQLEMSQSTHMDEVPPFSLLPQRCAEVGPLLRRCVVAARDWARQGNATN